MRDAKVQNNALPPHSLEDLAERIQRIEKAQYSAWGIFLKYIASPLLLLIIGSILNARFEDARQDFQRLEIEVKQVDAAQKMLGELFSDIPERAFIADRLMSRLIDKQLAAEVSDMVAKYYAQKLNAATRSGDIDKIVAAAEAIGGPAAEKVTAKLRQANFYVVVASLPPDRREEAVMRAKDLGAKGYDSAVYYSSSGYFTVTAGHLPFERAKELRQRATVKNDIPDDSYIIPGRTFGDQIYPN